MEQKIKNIYGIEMNDCKISGDIIVTDGTHPKLSNSSKTGKNFELKPFDKVLVRESNDFPWRIDLFSHIQDGAKPYVCLYHYWKYCIPYEGNEHLLGTTNDYKEE